MEQAISLYKSPDFFGALMCRRESRGVREFRIWRRGLVESRRIRCHSLRVSGRVMSLASGSLSGASLNVTYHAEARDLNLREPEIWNQRPSDCGATCQAAPTPSQTQSKPRLVRAGLSGGIDVAELSCVCMSFFCRAGVSRSPGTSVAAFLEISLGTSWSTLSSGGIQRPCLWGESVEATLEAWHCFRFTFFCLTCCGEDL